jgi:serine phosphatase RsbU (regulator of sigma subunit)
VNRLNCAAGAALATALIVTLDGGAGIVRWAAAGHCAPLLISDAHVVQLDGPTNLLLGVDPDAPYSETEVPINPGDRLVMFTDGLVERHRRCLDDGLNLLTAAARQPFATLDDCADNLLLATDADNREDDVCLLVTEFRPQQQGEALQQLANPHRRKA